MAEGCYGPDQRLKRMKQLVPADGLQVTWREHPNAQYKPRSIPRIVAHGFILYGRVGYPCVRANNKRIYMEPADYQAFQAARQAQENRV